MRATVLVTILSLFGPPTLLAQNRQGGPPAVAPSSQDDQIMLIFPEGAPVPTGGWWVTMSDLPVGRGGTPTQLSRAAYVGVRPADLAAAFQEFVRMLGPILNVSVPTGPYRVDEIELEVSVTAEGKIGLFVGGTVGATGGIRLSLRRQTNAP